MIGRRVPEGGNGTGGVGVGPNGAPNLVAMLGLPVVTADRFESLAKLYEEQDPTTHLPESYTKEQVDGYSLQQKVFSRLMRTKDVVFSEMMLFGPGGSVQNLHAHSRGNVLLNITNPEEEMLVDYRAGTNTIDILVMVELIKFMRQYMNSPEFAPYEPLETNPGLAVASDEDLINWAKAQIIPSVFHPVGTCAKMPKELGGVLDENLHVYGTKKLRVIDASMMPTIVGATTSMTVYAVAEKVNAPSRPSPGPHPPKLPTHRSRTNFEIQAADLIKAQTQSQGCSSKKRI
jgi:choline dehydrogenase-like flavoprotein